MKIAIFEIEDWERDACVALRQRHDLACTPEPLNERTPPAQCDVEIACPFVHSRLSGAVLQQMPRLRLVATRSTGTDHIDLEACRARGVTVCNVPNYGDNTVAEHTFALMLAVAHRLIEAVESTRRGDFASTGLRGFDLYGRRLGVIGAGRIGRRVIGIAKGFGMDVLAFDAQPDPRFAAQAGFRYVALNELLAQSDVVTLHVPATKATAGLIGARELALMKPDAVLINTARGDVVDVTALVRALQEKRLRGAGLDVLPQEPLLRDEAEIFRNEDATRPDLKSLLASHVLLQMPNVVVTPHNAFNTQDAVQRIIATTMENIEAFADGRPQNVVA
ncbi:MAG: hydroxyacid dehydrogenase [Hyphomicrobiales bacterium]|nr:hydroxyacid dehydrogenase [Hyphomicrobiales bacterium]